MQQTTPLLSLLAFGGLDAPTALGHCSPAPSRPFAVAAGLAAAVSAHRGQP